MDKKVLFGVVFLGLILGLKLYAEQPVKIDCINPDGTFNEALWEKAYGDFHHNYEYLDLERQRETITSLYPEDTRCTFVFVNDLAFLIQAQKGLFLVEIRGRNNATYVFNGKKEVPVEEFLMCLEF